MEEVMVRIIGTQISNGDEDRIDFSTTGWFERRGDSFVLSFDEYNADSGEIKTEVIMDGKAVTMQKTGAVETQMVFEPQKLYLAEYSTPFGDLDVNIFPTMVDTYIGDGDGKIELEYVLNIGGSKTVSRINMRYSKKGFHNEERSNVYDES